MSEYMYGNAPGRGVWHLVPCEPWMVVALCGVRVYPPSLVSETYGAKVCPKCIKERDKAPTGRKEGE